MRAVFLCCSLLFPDDKDALTKAVLNATKDCDFVVVSSGGASTGDFDFIEEVVSENGELLMDFVNMRPGKAQTFGFVQGTPVLVYRAIRQQPIARLEMLVRPALRKMQGYSTFDRPHVWGTFNS